MTPYDRPPMPDDDFFEVLDGYVAHFDRVRRRSIFAARLSMACAVLVFLAALWTLGGN